MGEGGHKMRQLLHAFVAVGLLAIPGCGEEEKYSGDAVEDSGDMDAPADTMEDVPVDEVVETGPPGCGNGVVEGTEVCDDGNEENEPCDTPDPDACLADCSLLMGECGDGEPDGGEQCDDGDDDSEDDCTTSCTANGHTIGDPCHCEGEYCNPIDLAAGDIVGCENAAIYANSVRELACLRSVTLGTDLYFAEGYCSLLAFHCEGDPCVTLGAREIGNVDTFYCPYGYAVATRIDTIGAMTVTTKTCHPVCGSHSECRWNAVEDPASGVTGCTDYACIAAGDMGETICLDTKNPP